MLENHPKLTVLHENSTEEQISGDDDMKDVQSTPPSHLDDEASRLWKAIVPEIKKIGYLKKIDQPALELYCRYYALYIKSEQLIEQQGLWIYDNDNVAVKRSPGAIQMDSCVKNMKSLGHDLGLTFDSGLRQITVKEPEKPKQDSPLKEVKFGADV